MNFRFHILLALAVVFLGCSITPAAAREDSSPKTEKKGTPDKMDKGWIKRELTRRKQGLAELIKVTDEASADAALEKFKEIWGVEGDFDRVGWRVDEGLTFADPMPSTITDKEVHTKAGKHLLKISKEAEKVKQNLRVQKLLNDKLKAATSMLSYGEENSDNNHATGQQAKNAGAYIKRELARRKKGLALLRKVKDEASAAATAEKFIEIWGLEGTEGEDDWAFNENVTCADKAPESLDGPTLYRRAGKKLLKISDETDKIKQELMEKGLLTKELRSASTYLFYSWLNE